MKKLLILLVAVIGFGISANAGCVTASLKGSQWSPNCTTNYLELKNNCNVNMVVVVEYFDKSRDKWIKETAHIYGNATYGICFNGSQYRIISQKEA
jgi:hypothetical protein